MGTRRNGRSAALADWEGFYEELQKETPRAAVIIAAAFMNGRLWELLVNFMVEDKGPVHQLLGTEDNASGPLGSFAARIMAAYCLGLISSDEYHDLNTIRHIRNRFAHRMHGFSFDDPEIVTWCKSLQTPRTLIKELPHLPQSHGSWFLLAVSLLGSRLALRALNAERQRRVVPKGFEFAEVVQVSGDGVQRWRPGRREGKDAE
ncbi:MAG TPA: MltR family transcriptional regulator [Phycisphaerae bacterium]|nr:MltR family transcriptional regulator [Phycisphaerae bacterium]